MPGRAGAVGVEQARVIAQALDDLPRHLDPAILRRAEEHLTGLAADFPPRLLRRLGRRVLEVVAPEVAEEEERKAIEDAERRARAETFLLLRSRGDGCTDLRGRIPDLVATRLTTYLQAFAAPRRAHLEDRADAPGIDPESGRRVPYSRLRWAQRTSTVPTWSSTSPTATSATAGGREQAVAGPRVPG
jgi:Domain of unknown function (DUF222)